MAQDLRELLKEERKLKTHQMPEGHEARFMHLLDKELPQQKTSVTKFWLFRVAASVVVVLGLGLGAFQVFKTTPPVQETVVEKPQESTTQNPTQLTLGDISPDLKKVENYYLTNINLELLDLQITDENKQLLDGYMQRLTELNDEYKKLNNELNQLGPNEQTITALIGNLQLRLQLLYRLKEKLNELKDSKNESYDDNQV